MAAASVAIRRLITGEPRSGRMVSEGARAGYLVVDDGPMLALLWHDLAVRVPNGVMLGAGERVAVTGAAALTRAAAVAGTPARVGDGAVMVRDLRIRVDRWWDCAVPKVTRPAAGAVAGLTAMLPALPPTLRAPVDRLATALASAGASAGAGAGAGAGADAGAGHELAAAVHGLLGLGPGSTPAGDDVLAGALAALHALAAAGRPAAERRDLLIEQVRRGLDPPGRTATFSATLLRYACDGAAIPQVQRVLRECAAGPARSTRAGRLDGAGRLKGAVRRLVEVGGTSGAALGHGLALGLVTELAPGLGGLRREAG